MEVVAFLLLALFVWWWRKKWAHAGVVVERRKTLADQPKTKSYPVAIVGESNYQAAIRKCKVGDYVDFYRELGNPFSKSGQPLAVTDLDGRTLGYIPEDSWLKRVVYEDGKGIVGKITVISKGEGRTYGVWLTVTVDGPPLGTREFTRN